MKSSSNSYAVIGLGFGDEGKGLATHSLCSYLDYPLVIRYSGGQQAGHTVTMDDGTSHVFSNFGSGSFAEVPTYWSKYCTVDPVGIMKELEILLEKGVKPTLYIDRKAAVTTPFDKWDNTLCSKTKEHGTCGVGVGSTLQREEDFYSLQAGDLEFSEILDIKLDLISDYYAVSDSESVQEFMKVVEAMLSYDNIQIVNEMPEAGNHVFEGSQGLLLDQHNGFFPHVTRSNTGTKNILDMTSDPHLYLITRAYQTRHGNGPMTNEDISHNIIDNPDETNVSHEYQGDFRKSILDLSLLKYAVERDEGIRNARYKTLIVTCCDHIDGDYQYTIEGKLKSHSSRLDFCAAIARHLGIKVFVPVGSASGSIF